MSPILGRFYRNTLEAEDQQKIGRILLDTGTPAPTPTTRTISHRSGEGDPHRLRGIPTIARGVPGTAPGTDPLRETIRRLTRIHP